MTAWRSWLSAERDDRDEDADVQLRAAFRTVPRHVPDEAFVERVAARIAADTRRRARAVRLVVAAAGLVLLMATVALAMQLPRLLGPMFSAGVSGLVWSLTAVDRGVDAWSLLARMARVAAAVVVTPQVTLVLMTLAVIAIGALYGLNRMLELEERSS